MPWQELSAMTLRDEFTRLARHEDANVRELCRRFGISPTTGYKWITRSERGEPLCDLSRRPQQSPGRCSNDIEAAIVALRDEHPAWGARKLTARLETLGHTMPAVSTVHAVLRRHGRITPAATAAAQPWQRFEHPTPNALWQMDFKGHVAMQQGRCHPLTVLDDHSRYSIVLQACADQTRETVMRHLINAFEIHGLPQRMTMDNGSPWGTNGRHYTELDVWLMRQGIRVGHSRPFHPQTQGKDERFHRSLKAEVMQGPPWIDLAHAQRHLDDWRSVYNHQRPHQALTMQVPGTRYRISERRYVANPAPPQYGDGDQVRRVQTDGTIHWKNRPWKVGKAFAAERVAVRPSIEDGQHDVFWSTYHIARINLINGTITTGRSID